MKAKKSLGQHFLNSPDVVADIIAAGDVSHDDTVLEVGPGEGVLTAELVKKSRRVVAVEKDDRMIPLLEERFKKEIREGKLSLIHGDMLAIDPHEVTGGATYKLIANIPYYITGELLRMFFESKHSPARMVVMVQKEVAERIVAADGKESILSISVKVFGRPSYIKTIPSHFFTPAPNVDSAILLIESITKDFFMKNTLDEARFFEMVKTGFAHKRKLLIRNLEVFASKEVLESAFSTLNIPRTIRAEEMTLDMWASIASVATHV